MEWALARDFTVVVTQVKTLVVDTCTFTMEYVHLLVKFQPPKIFHFPKRKIGIKEEELLFSTEWHTEATFTRGTGPVGTRPKCVCRATGQQLHLHD